MQHGLILVQNRSNKAYETVLSGNLLEILQHIAGHAFSLEMVVHDKSHFSIVIFAAGV